MTAITHQPIPPKVWHAPACTEKLWNRECRRVDDADACHSPGYSVMTSAARGDSGRQKASEVRGVRVFLDTEAAIKNYVLRPKTDHSIARTYRELCTNFAQSFHICSVTSTFIVSQPNQLIQIVFICYILESLTHNCYHFLDILCYSLACANIALTLGWLWPNSYLTDWLTDCNCWLMWTER